MAALTHLCQVGPTQPGPHGERRDSRMPEQLAARGAGDQGELCQKNCMQKDLAFRGGRVRQPPQPHGHTGFSPCSHCAGSLGAL